MKLTLNKEYSVSIEHPLGKVNPFFEYWTNQSTEVQAAERIQKPVGQTSEIENFPKLEFRYRALVRVTISKKTNFDPLVC